MSLMLWFKLAALVLVPPLVVAALHRSAGIGRTSRRWLDARFWRTPRPLVVLLMLLTLTLSLVLPNWGVESHRGPEQVFLAWAASLSVAMLVTWVLAHGITALDRPSTAIRFGLASLCVLAWMLAGAAFTRIALPK